MASETHVAVSNTEELFIHWYTYFFGEDIHRRISSLAIQRLVLDSNGIDTSPEILVRLNIVDEVIRELLRISRTIASHISIVEVVVFSAPIYHAVQFHPTGRT